MASHTTVLDDLDDETAQLIIRWQLEDIDKLAAEESKESTASSDKDDQVARRFYEAELKAYRSLRGFAEEEVQDAKDDGAPEPPLPPVPACHIPQSRCSVCGDYNVSDNDYPALCGHHYCGDCLSGLFSTAMRDERLYPPRCCSQHMPFDDARVFLDKDVETEFNHKKEELDDSRRTYCHVPTCSAYIPQSNKRETSGECPTCHLSTCILCRGAHHTGDCPEDEAENSTLEAARQKGWQRCYTCNRMVELTIGCNHIT